MTLEMSPHPLASSALQGRMRARGEAPATPRPLLPTCRRAEGARGKFAGRLGGSWSGGATTQQGVLHLQDQGCCVAEAVDPT